MCKRAKAAPVNGGQAEKWAVFPARLRGGRTILAGVLIAAAACGLAGGAARQPVEDKPAAAAVAISIPVIDWSPLMEARREAQDWAGVPLDEGCRAALQEACAAHGVPVCLALGLMEVESGFDPEADSGVSKGLMQLNKRYFPENLSPEENIRAGVAYLGELLARHADIQAALTCYNAGHDTGDRTYAQAVLAAAEKWGCG